MIPTTVKGYLAEGLIKLMEHEDFQKITISDLAKKAGVSRMSFYSNFTCKEDILEFYIQEMIKGYLIASSKQVQDDYLDINHIAFALDYFDQYHNFFELIQIHHLEYIVYNCVNNFVDTYITKLRTINNYALYCYAGALFNTFLKWQEEKKESSIEIATYIHSLFIRD